MKYPELKRVVREQCEAPRLWGEVGSRARRGYRVRGSFLPHLWMLAAKTPLTPTLSRKRGEGVSRL